MSLLERIVAFCIDNKLIVFLLVAVLAVWGVLVAPFDWEIGELPRDPVPVDAIPDIGENQQIVFTEWMGRSPQDIEDQISIQRQRRIIREHDSIIQVRPETSLFPSSPPDVIT